MINRKFTLLKDLKRALNLVFLMISLVIVITSCSEEEQILKVNSNEYSIDGEISEIIVTPYWKAGNSANGTLDHIVFDNLNGSNIDRIKITPNSKTKQLKGKYIYSRSNTDGTYNLSVTYNYNVSGGTLDFDWITNGENGEILEIELIEDRGANSIYDISISSFNLEYGRWVYIPLAWVSEGNKQMVFHYRGVIDL